MAKQEYRSDVRSRRMIREAFVSLLMEKEADKITVTDIVKRADINRSTFYAHYPDVRGVVEEKLEEIVKQALDWEIGELYKLLQDPLPFLLRINGLLEELLALYRQRKRTNGSDQLLEQFRQMMERMLVDKLCGMLATGNEAYDRRIARCVVFYIGGLASVYMQWVHAESSETLDVIAAEVARFAHGAPELVEECRRLTDQKLQTQKRQE